MTAEQLSFNLGHRAAFAREDFWVSACNREAVGWLDRWPDWPAPALVIYGPPASGKTHLLHVWQAETGAAFADARHLPVAGSGPARLIVDGADLVAGDAAAEESLLHLYNAARETGGHLLLTGETPPSQWPLHLPDLQSRLRAAPAVGLGPPDDELLAVVLTKLFSDRQIAVPPEVIQYVLPRIERSFAAARDLVEKIDRKALSQKRAVTVPLVRDVL